MHLEKRWNTADIVLLLHVWQIVLLRYWVLHNRVLLNGYMVSKQVVGNSAVPFSCPPATQSTKASMASFPHITWQAW